MALIRRHVSKFSPDNKLFALINEQGILKIWDTETNQLKQEYIPNLHLSVPCTSLAWVVASTKSGKKKKSKQFVENDSPGVLYLAMGTNKGGVSMFSFASGKIEWSFSGEGHTSRVNDIIYDNSKLLYTCSDDCQILVWSISDEKKIRSWSTGNEKLHSILYLPESNSIFVGGRQLKQYSCDTEELLKTYTGHTSEITLLKYIIYEDVEYVISASKMERIICLWTTNPNNKSKNAFCTFVMEDIAHCVSSKLDKSGNLEICTVTRSGVIHYYVNNIGSLKTDKAVKPRVTIEIASDSTTIIEPIPALAASLEYSSKSNNIIFGYGNNKFLLFERVVPNFEQKQQVLIRKDPKNLITNNVKENVESNLKSITPIVKSKDVEYNTPIVVNKRKQKEVQIPMETRLQNLNLSNGDMPKVQSQVQLLIQALHSKDATMLWSVLSTKDTKVIGLTLQKLPVQYVGTLVNELTPLMQKKGTNVQIAATWLKFLVKTHSSQLMALGSNDLMSKFGPCISIIEHRTNCLKDLSRLNGRLELLLSQIKRNTEEETLNNDNVLIYEDRDSSNSDVEDNGMKSSSEDAWEEDDSGEEMDIV